MMIRDSNGRIGVVIEDRGDCIFAVPMGSPDLIDGIHPGVGRAKFMTATAWDKQPDGSYRGFWFDAPVPAQSIPAKAHADSKDMLRRAGEALYGGRWQSAIARDLEVGDRRVREWLAGDRRTPPGVWTDIASLLRQRQSEGLALLRELEGLDVG